MSELICISCPNGCLLTVDEALNVTGNSCERGITYGKNEVMNPTRVATSTVRLVGGAFRRCPVKTNRHIPKKLVPEAIQALNEVALHAPVFAGQVALANVCGTGADFIATRNMRKAADIL
jgi:CxxC motif-containing protein